MALIKCPECGKEISDKAAVCINCGCPISETPKYKIIVTGYDRDTAALAGINKAFGWNLDYNQVMEILNNLPYTLAEFDSREEMELYASVLRSKQWEMTIRTEAPEGNYTKIDTTSIASEMVRCPKCGSAQITTTGRGLNWFWGVIGAGKTVNRCAKCGYTWKPHL